MRSLTIDEITRLESQACEAEDWAAITVSDDFTPKGIYDVQFAGRVRLGSYEGTIDTGGARRPTGVRHASLRDTSVGDNCLISNVELISGYTIDDETAITSSGYITATEDATFGVGASLTVLSEGGHDNVTVYNGMSSQVAALQVMTADDPLTGRRLRDIVRRHANETRPDTARIGRRAKITNAREVTNTAVGDECEINGAAQVAECTLESGSSAAAALVGSGVIVENCIIEAGASVSSATRLRDCFVGEACRISDGFSAENSLFFANSQMYNGEACAAFCGPFSVSHHKASLLIGVETSFYNAGSATNYSNHTYKLGPIHHGLLQRGAKTASSTQILLPVKIGAFSLCMGKILTHPDTRALPFSYIISEGRETYIVPGRALTSVGTYRDWNKWPQRDHRPRAKRNSRINMDDLPPSIMASVIEGRDTLLRLREEQGADAEYYEYGGGRIRQSSLRKGLASYDLAIRLFLGSALSEGMTATPAGETGTGDWHDLGGMLIPDETLAGILADIASGTIGSLGELDRRLDRADADYNDCRRNFAHRLAERYYGLDALSDEDIARIQTDARQANDEYIAALREDVEREYALGDVSRQTVDAFLANLKKDKFLDNINRK